jgi:2-iminobutanoate/2-iminopropanoate deaminase
MNNLTSFNIHLRAGARTALMSSGVALALLAATPSASSAQEYYRHPGSTLPFADAVRAGPFLYVAGQIGESSAADPEVKFGEATQKAMGAIDVILKANGTSFDHVVQCTAMLSDMKMFPVFNRAYAKFFKPERLPARATYGVSALAKGASLEVQCMAYDPAQSSR